MYVRNSANRHSNAEDETANGPTRTRRRSESGRRTFGAEQNITKKKLFVTLRPAHERERERERSPLFRR